MAARKNSNERRAPATVRGEAASTTSWLAASSRRAAAWFAVTPWPFVLLRVWLIAMFAATLTVTQPLWGTHFDPPMLPLAPMPRFDGYGELLLLTYGLCFFWPRAALGVHIVAGLAAMTADQTRMQPQIFSFWLLMLGTWPQPTARWLGRCHLGSLWLFSGLHKLLSPAYFRDIGPWMFHGLFPAAQWPSLVGYDTAFAATVAIVETLLGIAVFVPSLRRWAAVVGALVHGGILCVLWRLNWNTSVWAWNGALVVAAPVLIGGWRGTAADMRRSCGRVGFAAGLALYLSPLLYYVGLLDAYLSYCLYSANVPTATYYPLRSAPFGYVVNRDRGSYWKNLNVPQPPTHRNFELYFRAVAQPGDMLVVDDPRVCARRFGYARYAWRYDGTSHEQVPLPPAATP